MLLEIGKKNLDMKMFGVTRGDGLDPLRSTKVDYTLEGQNLDPIQYGDQRLLISLTSILVAA